MASSVFKSDHRFQRYEEELRQCSLSKNASVRPLGIALFGLGRIGIIHMKNLLFIGNCQLIYCVEPDRKRAEYFVKKYRLNDTILNNLENQSDVFNDPRVDAVVVCTPTQNHQEIVLKALAAGKSVLCEKPLASTYEGIRLCYESAKLNNKILLCAFNRRFDPAILSVRKRLLARDIGKINMVKTCSRDCPRPSTDYLRTSGGIFHDCAVHDIDIICWMMDSYPITVYCTASALIPEIKAMDDFDNVAIVMTFPSGTIGIIDLSRHAVYGYDQRLEVFGTLGVMSTSDTRCNSLRTNTEGVSTVAPICYSFASRYADAYLNEMEEFLSEIRNDGDVAVTGENTLAVNKIASACERSARNGVIEHLNWN